MEKPLLIHAHKGRCLCANAVARGRNAESAAHPARRRVRRHTLAPHGPGWRSARRSAGHCYTPCTHLPNEVGRSEGSLMKKVLVVLAFLLVPGIALAVPTITFDTTPGGAGGTLVYGGAGGGNNGGMGY